MDWRDFIGWNNPVPDDIRQHMTQPPQPSAWAQAHPTAAEFARQAMFYGPMSQAPGMRAASNPIPLQSTLNIKPPANTNWPSIPPLAQAILEYLRSKPDQSASHAELMRHLGVPLTPKIVKPPEDEGGAPPQ